MAYLVDAFGLLLLAVGLLVAYRIAPDRPGTPPAGWFPDPAYAKARSRRWDERAWTAQTQPGDVAADRGRWFRGRFWGRWAWIALAALVVLGLGVVAYRASESTGVIAVVSFLAMTGVCWAFYRFVARQLALDDVIGLGQVAAVAAAVGGATLVLAANINSWLIDAAGTGLATKTVGFVEEGTKLLVPLALFALGKYRDPRAGIAIGLAAGFGFAIAETTQYAFATANASGPDFCGDDTATPTVNSVVAAQITRIFTVSPLHWFWTGIAAAIAWRLWHLYADQKGIGRKGLWGGIAAIAMVMVIHSLNDTSATLGCGKPSVTLLLQLGRWILFIAMYLLFRAMARKSTPPQLVGRVSRGWTPHRLPTRNRPYAE
ncbi:MAG: PrsW family intramembrane metalloprotease [Hamadaea sp.]|uniref:PrsW family glutamic-type intramembrane protease n=1 Tax=Hamadaea sp. TaxID=2024425 RepID=UPI0017CC5A53|nr:PrsW family glutamic-type intramembrane protease [Hamadaea sp.]NUR69680.1 PrsW family intramembrane metalloprotease [Hamadaea sp.]NUT19547.1 PrsW family intramembrane metalloprotease [Hamadaea sp.]